MRVICLNGWGGKLHDEIVPYISSSDPDMLCLQEVVHTPTAFEDWLSYRDHGIDLPQRANFFHEIAEALPDHLAIFCPAAQGDLWHGETRYPSQWGLATFVRKSMAIVAQAQGFVHGTFSADGYGDHPRSRTGHAVRVFDFTTGQPAVIAHMHGLRDLNGKQDIPARLTQAKRLVQLVKNIAEDGDRIVVCGDFNVLPDSETFTVLKELELTLCQSEPLCGLHAGQSSRADRSFRCGEAAGSFGPLPPAARIPLETRAAHPSLSHG